MIKSKTISSLVENRFECTDVDYAWMYIELALKAHGAKDEARAGRMIKRLNRTLEVLESEGVDFEVPRYIQRTLEHILFTSEN